MHMHGRFHTIDTQTMLILAETKENIVTLERLGTFTLNKQ